MSMTLTMRLIRPEGNEVPFFYEVEEDLIAGVSALRQHFISRGLFTFNDEGSSGDYYDRVLTFPSQDHYIAFRRIMGERYPSYTTIRMAYCDDNSHEAEFTLSEPIDPRYNDPDEETIQAVRAILYTL